jgi:hypothetical protein
MSALAKLKKLLELRNELKLRAIQNDAYKAATANVPTEQLPTQAEWFESLAVPMKQGVYRGYAGDNSAMAMEGPLFVANQWPMAETFARRRAWQTGEAPHLEMFLLDPQARTQDYRLHPPDAANMSVVRKVDPRALSGRTELYARGGLAQMKECACGR